MDIDFRPDPSLFPFESRFFESSAGRVHYIDEGSGSPIVFLHGNPTWSFLYRDIIKGLSDSFRCIAIDYPGFGLSDRPDNYGYTPIEHAQVVGELTDHLDLEGFLMMLQDWGGPIGLKVACDRAPRVRGLILGNTWFWPLDELNVKFFSKIMSSGFMQRQIIENNFFVERLYPMGHARRPPPHVMDHYRKVQPSPAARTGVAVFPRELMNSRPLLEELWASVPRELGSKPVLIVWGLRDMAFRPRTISRIEDVFSDVHVVPLRNASHYLQEDAPEEIVEAIRDRFAPKG
ncbi:MAG TPA: alpha/beta fold hydrolase [Actinomycetota bacterium]|nr:alpha/beta fold hydrolase [Actinomycetota bacterium]